MHTFTEHWKKYRGKGMFQANKADVLMFLSNSLYSKHFVYIIPEKLDLTDRIREKES